MKKIQKILFIICIILFLISINYYVDAENIELKDDIKINIPLKESIRRSTYNALLANEPKQVLETRYNLKEDLEQSNIPITVKNQLNSGSCWAFSYSSVLETSISKQLHKTSKIFSPMHIEYMTAQMFNRATGSGAGPRLSLAYAVSGYGPVEESQMPFESVYTDQQGFKSAQEVGSLEKPLAARINESVEFTSMYKKIDENKVKCYKDSNKQNAYSDDEVKAARDLVKEHIKNYGAVSADLYIDTANYYNQSTGAYNYNDYDNERAANHVVSLVGWDDDYDVGNFKEGKEPKEKGAYIVLNSYGTEFGNDGYMYISYEDACIERSLMGLKDVEEYENNELDYDKIYQYDELGMNLGLPLGNEIYAACVYDRENLTDKDEYIQEVGIYMAGAAGVQVYINANDDNIEDAQLVATKDTPLETGYHVIELPTQIKLTGDKFVIKVKYTNQEMAYIPLEVNYKNAQLGGTSGFYDNATANDGESYISNDGEEWSDVNLSSFNETHSLSGSSCCIKAFTTYQAKENENKPVESIKLNKSKVEIEEGDTLNLVVTVTPEDATNKNVTWESSDITVAKVSENGIITAIKEGETTITATSQENGEIQAKCIVTVKKKVNSDDDIYDDEDEDKNEVDTNKNKTNTTNNKKNTSKDNTVSKLDLPNTGGKIILFGIIIFASLISSFIFVRYRSYKDIK